MKMNARELDFGDISFEEYKQMSDDELVELVHQGDMEAQETLIKRYKNFVLAKSRSYFLVGADREDIVQEGMIGLYKAVRDYKIERLASFRAFAELCITRQIITAIKAATRQKHQPLNTYISLNKPIYDEESDRTLLDILKGGKLSNPEALFISNETYDLIESEISSMLSDLEFDVLQEYLDGKSYQKIAEALNKHVKSVDNALQRVKRKLEVFLEKHNI
ncbi:RNA polymerase, sigma 30 subunit, SigH [Halanaerobium congolense]|uniref:RNA polymerase sigma-30 (SigH) subunit n=1 Tax=Halanaerobium congolense TaxID=54121 RepID=A0A1G6STC1_9FIRM|nr:RNA polymerase sporulation sigma factor SigH [Halanaerobium congolense]PTX15577.1 RNA polymerase sigma-30 (SigH) subunit [Halanaerobium congolense]PXV58820.1 RNA polymerase sporulation-specific sigma factor [Halanaerobium congolense]TDP16075.1 RNA polymerase sigma-30 (SigH) subunit [Halanaerobium congolense]TDS31663.1 RNA polymerase sigma-30 (SigH) subunit [Halanaerobium congolense]TDX43079.1 RNA polymerase sigma-30 (SigH) subunit [Halanaerobium congolense]